MDFTKLLSHPNENGILEFVLGILFILSIYHLFLFFQNKDKAYLYYSLYTFLTIFGYVCLAKNNVTALIIAPVKNELAKFDVYSKFLYNAMYFVFAFEFVGVRKKSKKWTQYIFYPLIFIVSVGTMAQIVSLITDNNIYIFKTFHVFFIPAIFVPTIIGYVALFKFSFIGKNYIIWGSFILFVSSMTGVLLHHVLGGDETNEIRFTVFYIGLILENICFSLAIGYKHKLVLEQNQKREKSYLQKMLNSQEEERIRIAKELHDGIVQKIGTVILCMRNNEAEISEEKINKIASELSIVNQDLRNVSHRMMPKALTDLGLKSALEDLLESSLEYTGMTFEFTEFNITGRFSAKIEHNLYRMSQELLQNIIKHSQAKRVSFLLIKNKKNVLLKVEDDGVGFNVFSLKHGVGLDNINTRAALLQGTVEVESAKNKGTIITIKIPLQ
ncbi:signal transduction histidine kinase [Wenyingzhuangia heitensis]|uniref:histidine kinase n=1 Tax=Wenyingzhuangia heitensis TaxID=1487859 RepID=A0ABX0U5Q6_9FLAO|nr:sensor histidine kinase [Wenyingzhuangia heitensis]NIJ44174.1 signal transduction histidine kinase [Wenyingzhuangia heitensis]